MLTLSFMYDETVKIVYFIDHKNRSYDDEYDEDEETYYCYINQDEIDDIQEEQLVQKYLSDFNIGKMIARQRYEEYKLNKQSISTYFFYCEVTNGR